MWVCLKVTVTQCMFLLAILPKVYTFPMMLRQKYYDYFRGKSVFAFPIMIVWMLLNRQVTLRKYQAVSVEVEPFSLNVILLKVNFCKLMQDTGEWQQILMY